MKFLMERTLKIYFQLETFIMNDVWKQKMDFLSLDKIFVLNNILSGQMDKALAYLRESTCAAATC